MTTTMPKLQRHTSAGTSLQNNDPKIYKLAQLWNYGTNNLDIGGGKTEFANENLKQFGVNNYILDPYNRDELTNKLAINRIKNNIQYDTVTCVNVLNVIDTQEARDNVILECAKAIKNNGKVYFSIYKAPFRGEPLTRPDQWQEARGINSYKEEILKYFNKVEKLKGHYDILIASEPKLDLPCAYWQYTSDMAMYF